MSDVVRHLFSKSPDHSEKNSFSTLSHADFPDFTPGSVWLTGAGPGAPGLLSLLAYHGLCTADIVIHDALVGDGILKWVSNSTEVVYAGKRGGKLSPKQADITDRIVSEARQGKKVMRLKGGDPFLFGRGGEECERLAREGIPFRIIPGISSGLGGLAYAGIPATHRDTNHSVLYLTGHDATGDVPDAINWGAVAHAAPVIVMYMAMKHLTNIRDRLLAAGRDAQDRVTMVSNATLPDQTIHQTTLGFLDKYLASQAVPTPAIIVVGPVGDFAPIFNWYEGITRTNPMG